VSIFYTFNIFVGSTVPGPVTWPPRSPYFTTHDFLMLYVMCVAYGCIDHVASLDELTQINTEPAQTRNSTVVQKCMD
jgi:hypothetical protein